MKDKNIEAEISENLKTNKENAGPTKKCFVIMPIADILGYDTGHFNRVYHHIIKPACEMSGFEPIRADDINSSNMIVVDILKKIVESDLAICDLSGRNPNVLYELGLRQAFNKKTVLIKDNKTENIFDVQGFRYAQYDSALRIDNVKNEITKFSSALKDTYAATGDINSIVQLLEIEPAKIDTKTELTASDTVLFRAINELTKKVEKLSHDTTIDINADVSSNAKHIKINNNQFDVGETYFRTNSGGAPFGKLIKIDIKNKTLHFEGESGSEFAMSFGNPTLAQIDLFPF